MVRVAVGGVLGGGKFVVLGPVGCQYVCIYKKLTASVQESRRCHIASLTLRSTPPSLPHVKPAPHLSRVHLARLGVNQHFLRLHDRPRFPLVVHAQDLAPHLELPPLARDGDGLEELQFALAVEDVLGVEFGDARDGRAVGAGVEVDDFRVGVFEGEDDGVGGEGGEVGV